MEANPIIENLSRAIDASPLSVSAIAERSGLDERTVYRIRHRRGDILTTNAAKLAKVLNVTDLLKPASSPESLGKGVAHPTASR